MADHLPDGFVLEHETLSVRCIICHNDDSLLARLNKAAMFCGSCNFRPGLFKLIVRCSLYY